MRKPLAPLAWSLAFFALGCAGAHLAEKRVTDVQNEQMATRFGSVVERAVAELSLRFTRYEYGLRGARGAVLVAGENIRQDQFFQYMASREMAREFPGARGFGFIQRMGQADAGAFEDRERARGRPEFRIHQLAPHDGERLVIRFMEPEAPNRPAIGLDIASEPRRLAAAGQAIRTGNPVLSQPLELVQVDARGLKGLLFLLPVYRTGQTPDSEEQRKAGAVGLVYAPLVVRDVLAGLASFRDDLTLSLFDADLQDDEKRFYASDGAEAAPSNGLRVKVPLSMYGRQWEAEIRAAPAFVAGLNLSSPVLLYRSMVGGSAVLAGFLFVALIHRRQRRQAFMDRARLAAIADNVDDGIVGLTRSGRISSWNRAAEKIFAKSSHDVIGRPWADLLETSGIADARPAPQGPRNGAGHAALPVRARCQTADRHVDLEMKYTQFHNGDGSVGGTAVVVRDITEHQDAEERFRLAVDAAPTAMLMVGPDQRIMLASRKTEELFGYSAAELLGMPLESLMPLRYRSGHAHNVAMYRRNPLARPMGEGQQLQALHRDGHEIPVEIGLNPVRTRQGLCTLASITDISVRLHLESRLHGTLQRLQLAIEIAKLGVWVWHSEDGRQIWDERMFAIFDVPQEGRGQDNYSAVWRSRMHPEDLARVEHQLGLLQAGALPAAELEFRVVRASGEERHIQASAAVEQASDGRTLRVVGVNRDVTEQRVAEEQIRDLNASLEDQVAQRTHELHAALAEAEKATRAKSEFLANMSHEIRTPMNAILGLCYLLEKQPLDDAARHMVARIHDAGQTLLGIINDVLDLSKIEAHHLRLENAPFDLSEVLDSVATIMASSVGDKAIELIVSPHRREPTTSWGTACA